MPGTPGPRTGLASILATGEAPTILRTTINAVITWLEGNAMLTSAGLLSARPTSTPGTPGIAGRRFYATDTGVEYRDTGTGWLALGVELVTSLPASPFNGQTVDYLADATNGIVWRLRYRSASSSAYKWECVGGSKLTNAVIPTDVASGPSGTFGDIATVGPQITVPLAGDYLVDMAAEYIGSAAGANAVAIGLMVNGAQPGANNDRIAGGPPSNSAYYQAAARAGIRVPNLAAGSVLKVGYNLSGTVAVNINGRSITARPQRVG